MAATKMVISRIEPKSYARISALLGVLVGLVGVIAAWVSALMLPVGRTAEPVLGMGILTFFMPLLYGLVAFLVSYLFALLYNRMAQTMGGIEVQVSFSGLPERPSDNS